MSLFIVTYHYVRPLKKTKYPNLKALDISKFEKQIQFLKKNTTIIKIEDLDYLEAYARQEKFFKRKDEDIFVITND